MKFSQHLHIKVCMLLLVATSIHAGHSNTEKNRKAADKNDSAHHEHTAVCGIKKATLSLEQQFLSIQYNSMMSALRESGKKFSSLEQVRLHKLALSYQLNQSEQLVDPLVKEKIEASKEKMRRYIYKAHKRVR